MTFQFFDGTFMHAGLAGTDTNSMEDMFAFEALRLNYQYQSIQGTAKQEARMDRLTPQRHKYDTNLLSLYDLNTYRITRTHSSRHGLRLLLYEVYSRTSY